MVCSAPDALIPHQTWVHFAINSRKPKSADSAEARLFINGIRVGTMKITYPTANPLAPVSARTASSPDAIRVCVGRTSSEVPIVTGTEQNGGGKEDDNEIMLGRTMLLEETIPEDLVLLLHHLVCLNFFPKGRTNIAGSEVSWQFPRGCWPVSHL